jgi:hypothetical protein
MIQLQGGAWGNVWIELNGRRVSKPREVGRGELPIVLVE